MCFSNWLSGKRVYRMKDLQSSPWKSGCIPFKNSESHKASCVAQTVKTLPAMQKTWVQSLRQKDPLEKEMATHSSTLAWKFHGQRSLVGYSPWGRKELDTTERLHFIDSTLLQSPPVPINPVTVSVHNMVPTPRPS